jgi:hypothetical protein
MLGSQGRQSIRQPPGLLRGKIEAFDYNRVAGQGSDDRTQRDMQTGVKGTEAVCHLLRFLSVFNSPGKTAYLVQRYSMPGLFEPY